MGARTSARVHAMGYGLPTYGAGFPLPVDLPAPVGSWDFGNASSLILASGVPGNGVISGIKGVDGVTVNVPAIANTGINSVLRKGRLCAQFTGSTGMYTANGLGVAGACTILTLFEVSNTATTMDIVDIAQGAATFQNRRHSLQHRNTGGFRMSKCGTSNDQGVTAVVSGSGALALAIGRSPGTAASAPLINVNGVGTAVVGTTSGIPAGLDSISLGSARQGGASASFAYGWFHRVFIWNSYLTDAQCESAAASVAAFYGTPNLA